MQILAIFVLSLSPILICEMIDSMKKSNIIAALKSPLFWIIVVFTAMLLCLAYGCTAPKQTITPIDASASFDERVEQIRSQHE